MEEKFKKLLEEVLQMQEFESEYGTCNFGTVADACDFYTSKHATTCLFTRIEEALKEARESNSHETKQ